MPVKAARDPNRGILLAAAAGPYSAEELATELDPFYAGTPKGAHLLILLDLRRVDDPPAADALLATLVALGKARPSVPALAAVVAADGLGKPPGKLLRPLMSDVGLKMSVFGSPGEALDWLMSGVE